AQSGYNVVVTEVSDELLNKGLKSIDAVLGRLVAKEKISPRDKESTLARIRGTTDLGELSGCDIVIEAATEDMAVKKDIFARLDKVCPRRTILATNTSVLSVADIAAATKRPEQVLGLHFANPVPVMKILEMIVTIATSQGTAEIARKFGESIGKTVVTAKDLPGFISNRISTSYLLNAVRLVQEGIATPEDIDTVFRLGAGHPMGPLQTLDLIGIDTVYRGASALYDELKDPQYAPPPLMKRMVALGWLGRKTGKGFYEYPKE
ncbi:MAG TPA: 3-hydroxyacyl-CoA dehydrogenase NAD-binding domain-containing protein, partial [Dehalococcoidales bacterium]|nr:3-hydroxyacyl-CoA dehydrogenase NAD-binding domain-containing protein [Dehalococcoidales bacterium]